MTKIQKGPQLMLAFFLLFSKGQTMAAPSYIDELWSSEQAKILSGSLTEHHYKGEEGTRNHYASFSFPDNKIDSPLFIITGLEDPLPLWFDTVLKAREFGFRQVFIIELRGQGQSQRVPGNNKKLIHVNAFDDYHKDLVRALKDIQSRFPTIQSAFFLTHSTGSLVLMQSLPLIAKHLPKLKILRLVHWTPLVRLEISPFLDNPIARPLLSFIDTVYRSCCGLLAGRHYSPSVFNDNKLTGDLTQFEKIERLKYKYGLGSKGVSLAWGLMALQATQDLRDTTLNKISIPSLFLLADQDSVVNNDFEMTNPQATIQTLPKAQHALHTESPPIFDSVTEQSFQFFMKSKAHKN